MPVSRVISTLLAALFIAAVASPALACKGTESLLRDEFHRSRSRLESCGGLTPARSISRMAKSRRRSDPGYAGVMMYEGDFFPAADACVDITMPDVRDPSYVWAGFNF